MFDIPSYFFPFDDCSDYPIVKPNIRTGVGRRHIRPISRKKQKSTPRAQWKRKKRMAKQGRKINRR